jgi:hypothetical protein
MFFRKNFKRFIYLTVMEAANPKNMKATPGNVTSWREHVQEGEITWRDR